MRLIRALSTAATVTLTLAQGVTAALAQGGDICIRLEARLIEIERGGAIVGNVDRFRQYDAPIAEQRNEIERAMAEARRAGCVGGFLIFQPKRDPKCGRLMATIERMQANLNRLESSRSQQTNDPFTLARERNEILRSMQMNRCGPRYVFTDRDPEPTNRGLFATLFGQPGVRTWGEDSFIDGAGFGTYRTLCVRTCDGYYFPISFSTVPGKFSQDAETCAQMCPGTEAVLYTHRNPGEDVAEAVTLAGEPYAVMPNAFRYRKEFDQACTCRSATTAGLVPPEFADFGSTPADDPWSSLRGSSDATVAVTAAEGQVPAPRPRPAFGEDPETVANRAGKLDPKPIVKSDGTELAGVTEDGRKIRIVGPAAFYAQ